MPLPDGTFLISSATLTHATFTATAWFQQTTNRAAQMQIRNHANHYLDDPDMREAPRAFCVTGRRPVFKTTRSVVAIVSRFDLLHHRIRHGILCSRYGCNSEYYRTDDRQHCMFWALHWSSQDERNKSIKFGFDLAAWDSRACQRLQCGGFRLFSIHRRRRVRIKMKLIVYNRLYR